MTCWTASDGAEIRTREGWARSLKITLACLLTAALLIVPAHASADGEVREVVVGALLDQSGARMMQDRLVEAALRIAVDEVNAYYSERGLPVRLTLRIGDTRTDPDHALLQLQVMAQEGIRLVVGPSSSQELFRVRQYAQTQGILLISPSSTAPSLALPGDLVFRMVPDDTRQGMTLADRMWRDGVRAVVPIRRDDVYSQDLVHYTRQAFESRDFALFLGSEDDAPTDGVKCRFPDEGSLPVQVCPGVVYNPRTVDFISEVQALSDAVSEAVRAYGARRVAVMLIAFEEAVPIFLQAAKSPILSLVRWYGTDGTAKSPAIANHLDAARFAAETSFAASIFAESRTDVFASLSEKVQQSAGVAADANAATAYDALWLIARAIEAEGPAASSQAIADALGRVAQGYAGASGTIRFNSAGDRDSANFDFWTLQRRGGAYEWVLAR